jgi:hypothetical protein
MLDNKDEKVFVRFGFCFFNVLRNSLEDKPGSLLISRERKQLPFSFPRASLP